jgi:CheY-like chemotaxis protein/DNA-binding XRE family transcriptional regulator
MSASQITSRFGASVRRLRHRLGLSQEALAERADLHRTYIAGIEGGARNVTLKSIDKLARALRVSTATLLSHSGESVEAVGEATRELPPSQCVDILIVEDSREDVELTLQAFRHAKITNPIHVVHNGAEALDYLFCTGSYADRKIKDRPQLVLLDLNLPKVSGMEVLRRIKADEQTRSIPVVVLTASRDSQEVARCRRLGAETSIVKPVDLSRFCKVTPGLSLCWTLFRTNGHGLPDCGSPSSTH